MWAHASLRNIAVFSGFVGTLTLTACIGAAPIEDETESSEDELVTDPFNAKSCRGSAMTAAQALAVLDVPNGVTSRQFGRFRVVARARSCYPGLACSEWQDAEPGITAPFATLNTNFTSDSTEARFRVYTAGNVALEYRNDAPALSFEGDEFRASWGASFTSDYISQSLAPRSVDPTNKAGSSDVYVSYVWSPSRGCPNGHCEGNSSIPGETRASFADKPLTLSGKVAKSCVRLAASGEATRKDSSGNTFTREIEVVLAAKLGSPCVATTCAAKNANCGTIDDGCGGKLDCGGCSGPDDTCGGGGTANQCGNTVTPYEYCSRQGKVYCEGRGCYDACF